MATRDLPKVPEKESKFDAFAGDVFGSGAFGRKKKPFSLTSKEIIIGDQPVPDTKRTPRRRRPFENDVHPSPTSMFSEMSDGTESEISISLSTNSPSEPRLDFFCVDHMRMCGTKSAMEKHRSCKEVITSSKRLDKFSRLTSAEKRLRDCDSTKAKPEDHLQKIYDFAGTFIVEREQYRQELKKAKEDSLDCGLDFVEDIITSLLTKKKAIMDKFDIIHKTNIEKISRQAKRCSVVQRERLKLIQRLKKLSDVMPSSESNEKYRREIQAAFEKCVVFKEILFREYEQCERLDYHLEIDEDQKDELLALETIGEVCVMDEPSRLPKFLQTSEKPTEDEEEETDFEHKDLVSVSTLDGRAGMDKSMCCFTGCTYVSQMRILMADWNNCCLKMFDRHGVISDRFVTPKGAWDVTRIRLEIAAVTVPMEKTVFVVNCDGKIKIESSFRTGNSECWGIVNVGGNLAITCDPWSNNPSVKLYSPVGIHLKTIQHNQFGRNLFRCPLHIGTDLFNKVLYVSDSSANVMLALTLNGQLIFVYEHAELDYPTGVASDRQNNLYICGKDSANVHKVTKDGECIQVMSSSEQDQGLSNPRAICFDPDGERVAITDNSSSSCNGYLTKML